MKAGLNFLLEMQSSGSKARAAKFLTLRGEVETPIFMPVATQATVKGQTLDGLKASGARVLLVNTYHLLLRPGMDDGPSLLSARKVARQWLSHHWLDKK